MNLSFKFTAKDAERTNTVVWINNAVQKKPTKYPRKQCIYFLSVNFERRHASKAIVDPAIELSTTDIKRGVDLAAVEHTERWIGSVANTIDSDWLDMLSVVGMLVVTQRNKHALLNN